MKYILAIFFSAFVFNSCTEYYDSDFKTYNEMIKSDAYKKGWIPEIVPTSSKNIHEWHDLDTNLGYGSFEFIITDYKKFKSEMESIQFDEIKIPLIYDKKDDWDYRFPKYPKYKEMADYGFILYKYERFYLAVNPNKGHAFFWHK